MAGGVPLLGSGESGSTGPLVGEAYTREGKLWDGDVRRIGLCERWEGWATEETGWRLEK